MTDDAQAREDFERLLPWYVNGTLDAAGRMQVDGYLRDHPEAASDLALHARMRQAVRSAASTMPADLGWEEFAQRSGLRPSMPPATRSLRALVAAHWQAATGWATRPAFGVAAMALVLLQAGVIGVLLFDRAHERNDFSALRAPTPGADAAPVLQLRFKAGTTEADVRRLLLAADARLVDGPNQWGDYLVSVPPGRIDTARQALAGSAMVDAVSVYIPR